MPDRPRDYVPIAVQPTRCPRPRADHLRNITRNRRLLGDNYYSHGLAPNGATKTKLQPLFDQLRGMFDDVPLDDASPAEQLR
jgi:hypothetical protein